LYSAGITEMIGWGTWDQEIFQWRARARFACSNFQHKSIDHGDIVLVECLKRPTALNYHLQAQ